MQAHTGYARLHDADVETDVDTICIDIHSVRTNTQSRESALGKRVKLSADIGGAAPPDTEVMAEIPDEAFDNRI